MTRLKELEKIERIFCLADLFVFEDKKGNRYDRTWFENELKRLRIEDAQQKPD